MKLVLKGSAEEIAELLYRINGFGIEEAEEEEAPLQVENEKLKVENEKSDATPGNTTLRTCASQAQCPLPIPQAPDVVPEKKPKKQPKQKKVENEKSDGEKSNGRPKAPDITAADVFEAINIDEYQDIPSLMTALREKFRTSSLMRLLELDASSIAACINTGKVYPYVERAVRQHLGFPLPVAATPRELAGLE